MKKIAVIADDLTGANDAGSQVFLQGYTCCSLNSTGLKQGKLVDVPVYNSSTRLLNGKKAYAKVKKMVLSLSEYDLIYKKTDSTLRGNIGQEIDGCVDALRTNKAAFVTALPALKRCSVYGRLFLDSDVIENTEFALDALNPVLTSNIIELLKNQSKYCPVLVEIDIIRKGSEAVLSFIEKQVEYNGKKTVIFVFDCISNTDLEIISKSLKGFRVIAGASALVKYLLKKKKRKKFKPEINIEAGQAFFIGSMKKITHEQLSLFKDYMGKEKFDPSNRRMTKQRTVIFSVKKTSKAVYDKAEGKRIDGKFAKEAVKLFKERGYGKLVLSGGATAENIFKALNINFTEITGSILSGIPLTYSPEINLYVVTKPGGYGDKNALITIFKRLKELQ